MDVISMEPTPALTQLVADCRAAASTSVQSVSAPMPQLLHPYSLQPPAHVSELLPDTFMQSSDITLADELRTFLHLGDAPGTGSEVGNTAVVELLLSGSLPGGGSGGAASSRDALAAAASTAPPAGMAPSRRTQR